MLRFKQFLKEKKDPCWKGYKQVGIKKKNGKKVPNCVPVEESLTSSIHHTKYKSYLKSYRKGHLNPSSRILSNLAGSDDPKGTPLSTLIKKIANSASKEYHQTGMVPKDFVKASNDVERLAAIKHHVSKIKKNLELKESSENEFQSTLRNYAHYHGQGKYIDLYHESPGHVKNSIEKSGFSKNESDGVFGTIGKHSDFVTGKKKTIVHMRVPINHVNQFVPDMPYGNRPESKTEDPHADFVDAHGKQDGVGGDVFFNHSNSHKFIHKITEV